MDHQTLRDGFFREFEGTQDARTKLHESFSKQGTQLIEYRKKLVEIIITVSAAFIAAPAVFKIEPSHDLYHTGLLLLIFTVIFSLLHLREHVDADEAKSVGLRNKLLSVLNGRMDEIKKYLKKSALDQNDAISYRQYREKEDYSEEMNNLTKINQQALDAIPLKAMDYTTCFILFLFTSGAFFVVISILFQNIQLPLIILIEILLSIITATNSANKLTTIYAKIVSFLKSYPDPSTSGSTREKC